MECLSSIECVCVCVCTCWTCVDLQHIPPSFSPERAAEESQDGNISLHGWGRDSDHEERCVSPQATDESQQTHHQTSTLHITVQNNTHRQRLCGIILVYAHYNVRSDTLVWDWGSDLPIIMTRLGLNHKLNHEFPLTLPDEEIQHVNEDLIVLVFGFCFMHWRWWSCCWFVFLNPLVAGKDN